MEKKLIPISVVVLSRNEEDNIIRCLKSLTHFQEIILLDDSTDNTVIFAEKLISGDQLKIIKTKEQNDFAKIRNQALKEAKNEWVLFIDADEELSSELQKEIVSAVINSKVNGYYIKRRDYFLGKWLKYGETGNIKLLKLGRKNAGIWNRQVHEVWKINGEVGVLNYPLFHYPHSTVSEFISRINRWTTMDAQTFYNEGKRSNFWEIILYPKAKFIVNYFLKLGFMDGMPGLIMALCMCFHSFLTRSKLFLLRNKC